MSKRYIAIWADASSEAVVLKDCPLNQIVNLLRERAGKHVDPHSIRLLVNDVTTKLYVKESCGYVVKRY